MVSGREALVGSIDLGHLLLPFDTHFILISRILS